MRILFITQMAPYPPDTGGKIKTLQTLKLLGKKHQVYLVCFITQKSQLKYQQKCKRFCESADFIYNPVIFARFRAIWPILLKSLFSLKPFEVYRYFDGRLARLIKDKLNQETFDAVHIDHLNMAQYLPAHKDCQWVLEEHNLDSQAAWEVAAKERSWFRLFYLWEGLKFWLWEKRQLKRFDRILTISDKDKQGLVKKGIESQRISVLPTPFPVRSLFRFAQGRKRILLLGSLFWWPNKDGFWWFYDHVWPRIKQRVSQVELSVVGQGASDRLQAVCDQDAQVTCFGYVKRVEPLLAKASVMVVPVRMGGGVKIKVLTGLAAGLPIVSTAKGVEGIKVASGKELFVADKEEAFSQAVVQVLHKAQAAKCLSKAGQEFIKQNYSSEQAQAVLARVYPVKSNEAQ